MNTAEVNRIQELIELGDLANLRKIFYASPHLLNHVTPFGTWLHVAANHGQLEIVKWLIQSGMNVNALGGIAGGNALTEAAEGGHTDVVEYLLSVGSEMRLEESEWNPLFAAIASGHSDVVRALLKAGIDANKAYAGPKVKNFDAYAFASEMGQHSIAQMIRSWIISPSEQKQQAELDDRLPPAPRKGSWGTSA